MGEDSSHVVEQALALHAGTAGGLLPIFHTIQDRLGYVPPESLQRIAQALNLSLSRAEVHGVLTFYHDFRTSAPGRHVVRLCRAEACQAMGGEALLVKWGRCEQHRDRRVSPTWPAERP